MIQKEFTTYTNYHSSKEEHTATKEKKTLLRIWKERQSRVFWTPNMKFNECDHSIYRFYPANDMVQYGRCYNFSCLG